MIVGHSCPWYFIQQCSFCFNPSYWNQIVQVSETVKSAVRSHFKYIRSLLGHCLYFLLWDRIVQKLKLLMNSCNCNIGIGHQDKFEFNRVGDTFCEWLNALDISSSNTIFVMIWHHWWNTHCENTIERLLSSSIHIAVERRWSTTSTSHLFASWSSFPLQIIDIKDLIYSAIHKEKNTFSEDHVKYLSIIRVFILLPFNIWPSKTTFYASYSISMYVHHHMLYIKYTILK